MTDRQEKILKAIIEEYITDASPVGSKKIAAGADFGIGPAMIRQEMAVLEDKGYLSQPHTSAGRVPTDKAYRRYISSQIGEKEDFLSKKEKEEIDQRVKSSPNTRDLLKELSKLTSELSSELSFSGLIGNDLIFTCGLSQLLEEPELQNFAHMSHLMRFMDDMESHFGSLWQEADQEYTRVFIGRENPIREIEDFALIAGQYKTPSGEEGFLSIVGPKRMNYRKNMALVDYISQSINQFPPKADQPRAGIKQK